MIDSFAHLGQTTHSSPVRQAFSVLADTRRSAAFAALFLPLVLAAGPGTAQEQSRYTVSPDGTEVTDSRTQQVWRRCAEGQTWDGSTCAGIATTFTHEQALAHASTQIGWRLPNVKELASLVDRSRNNPAIDTTAFPATSSTWFWTSSPWVQVHQSDVAWIVDFSNGKVAGYGRYDEYRDSVVRVRLVRVAAGR